jgi:hypothetical protein
MSWTYGTNVRKTQIFTKFWSEHLKRRDEFGCRQDIIKIDLKGTECEAVDCNDVGQDVKWWAITNRVTDHRLLECGEFIGPFLYLKACSV